jgi:hypothetical protein
LNNLFFWRSEEPRLATGLLEGAVLLERRKEMHLYSKARNMPKLTKEEQKLSI